MKNTKRNKERLFITAAFIFAAIIPAGMFTACKNPLQDIIAAEIAPKYANIIIRQNVDTIENGGAIFDFGGVMIMDSISVEFIIENLGSAALTLTGGERVALSGANADQFSVTEQPSSPVAASESTTFTIRFAPTSLGIKNAAVSITNNDFDEDPYTFAIDGTASWAGKQTVDSTGDVGWYTSLAVSGSGVYISYADLSNSDLKFAKSVNEGATW